MQLFRHTLGFIMLLVFCQQGIMQPATLSASVPSDNGYQMLVDLYNEFRTFHLPVVEHGVPDYSPAGMQAKFDGLMERQRRLAAIDTTGWSIDRQVDYRIVLAEMKGMEFEHRVTRPWEKDPAFYAVVRFQFGPKMHPSMPIPPLPVPRENHGRVHQQLRAIPVILEHARQNLTDPVADLAYIAIYTTNIQMERLKVFAEGLEVHHPEMAGAAWDAYNAIGSYRQWLTDKRPSMRNGAGVGVENYNWYLANVALLPYTWHDLLVLSEREYERAVATMKLKEHRNRHAPVLFPVDNLEDYANRYNRALEHLYRFLHAAELFSVPDYFPAPSVARGFNRGEARDYFEHVLDRYPLPLSVHGYAGHTHDELRTALDNRPIRGQNRLYFVDAVRAEALATGLERMLYHIGLTEGVPQADELTYHLKAFRASRSITDLKMHSNEMTFEEAFRFNMDYTPYGWVPENSPTLWHDLELYLRNPLYGTAYMIGPVQLDQVLTTAFLTRGDEFDILQFMDEFLESGMTPLSLISMEINGRAATFLPAVTDNDRLHQIMDEAERYRIRHNPFMGDSEGRYREDDKLPSESLADLERRYRFNSDLFERLEQEVDRGRLNRNNQIAYDLFRIELEHAIRSYEFNTHLIPGEFYNSLVGLQERTPMQSLSDYENYIKRLEAFPAYFEQYMVRYRKGLETGHTLPRVLFEPAGVHHGIVSQITDTPEESGFYEPFREFPTRIGTGDQVRLRQAGRRAIAEKVIPSYQKLLDFLVDEYTPAARESIGVSALPGGRDYYEHLMHYHTTLPLTAREIHETGLREVERIRGEMAEIIRDLAFEGSFEDFLEFLRTDPQFYVEDPLDLLKEASYLAKLIDGKLPSIFHLHSLPRRPYGVEPVPDHLAPRYTGGRYFIGRGNRGGYFWVNTYDLPSRPLYTLEALLYHEGVPGHHLEFALTLEMEDAPRRQGGVTAYSEGWALYAERLGLDVGLYQNPYSNFGRLTYEMWRACRLVVDTGIHAFDWTRDEVVDFMTRNTALSHHEIDTETDRYIRSTGQAVSYKMGELKIRELRDLAEKELGERFDLKDFHDAVLHKGPVPLTVLEEQVREYIAASRASL
jgi:uncharacterized protein (DUF885 family)